MNQSSNSVYNADHIQSLSDENKKLREANEKLAEECQFIIRILSKLHIKWERLKAHEKVKGEGERMHDYNLINMTDLQENINLIIRNKEKMLK